MPKTNEPKISLLLRKNKQTADGLHPIYLRVAYNGMVEKSTGINVDALHWDKKEKKVLKGFPNYRTINEQLSAMVQQCMDRMNLQRLSGLPYNRLKILDGSSTKVDERKSFTRLVNEYLLSHNLSVHTMRHYRMVRDKLIACFGDDAERWNVKVFDTYLSGLRLSDSTRRLIFNKCQGLGLDLSGFNKNKYKIGRRNGYIPQAAMPFVKEVALSKVGVIDGDGFKYSDEFINNINNKHWDDFAGIWIYVDYLFQGLAPVDLNQILKKDIVVKRINGNDYYCWDGKRSKTGVYVKIRIKRNIYTNMLISGIISFTDGERFLPIMPDDATDIDRYNKIMNTMEYRKRLKKFWREVNEKIQEYNDYHPEEEVPFIDETLTWYAVRHSFAMHYVSLPNSSPLALATLLGRSANSLAQYLETLNEDANLINAVDILY